MFALDHTNYSRWLHLHIRVMCELSVKHPKVFEQFNAGAFVVHRTTHIFSSITLDQAHEQENSTIKGDDGAIGLTENPAALRKWIAAGPAIARIIVEFENAAGGGIIFQQV